MTSKRAQRRRIRPRSRSGRRKHTKGVASTRARATCPFNATSPNDDSEPKRAWPNQTCADGDHEVAASGSAVLAGFQMQRKRGCTVEANVQYQGTIDPMHPNGVTVDTAQQCRSSASPKLRGVAIHDNHQRVPIQDRRSREGCRFRCDLGKCELNQVSFSYTIQDTCSGEVERSKHATPLVPDKDGDPTALENPMLAVMCESNKLLKSFHINRGTEDKTVSTSPGTDRTGPTPSRRLGPPKSRACPRERLGWSSARRRARSRASRSRPVERWTSRASS